LEMVETWRIVNSTELFGAPLFPSCESSNTINSSWFVAGLVVLGNMRRRLTFENVHYF